MGSLLLVFMVAALAGAVLALLRPPHMPRYWLLLAIAAVPQIGSIYGIWLPGMFLVSVAASWLWWLCNRSVPGVLLVGLGVMLNLLAMAFHDGAMPIHASVLLEAGYAAQHGTALLGSKDVVVQASPMGLLSDWMVLSYGAQTLIASPGDLVVVIGLVYWLLFSHSRDERACHAVVSRHPRAA
jgi:hypothetical protein